MCVFPASEGLLVQPRVAQGGHRPVHDSGSLSGSHPMVVLGVWTESPRSGLACHVSQM